MSTLIEDVALTIFTETRELRDSRDDRDWSCIVHEPWLKLARNIIALVHAHDLTIKEMKP